MLTLYYVIESKNSERGYRIVNRVGKMDEFYGPYKTEAEAFRKISQLGRNRSWRMLLEILVIIAFLGLIMVLPA